MVSVALAAFGIFLVQTCTKFVRFVGAVWEIHIVRINPWGCRRWGDRKIFRWLRESSNDLRQKGWHVFAFSFKMVIINFSTSWERGSWRTHTFIWFCTDMFEKSRSKFWCYLLPGMLSPSWPCPVVDKVRRRSLWLFVPMVFGANMTEGSLMSFTGVGFLVG